MAGGEWRTLVVSAVLLYSFDTAHLRREAIACLRAASAASSLLKEPMVRSTGLCILRRLSRYWALSLAICCGAESGTMSEPGTKSIAPTHSEPANTILEEPWVFSKCQSVSACALRATPSFTGPTRYFTTRKDSISFPSKADFPWPCGSLKMMVPPVPF